MGSSDLTQYFVQGDDYSGVVVWHKDCSMIDWDDYEDNSVQSLLNAIDQHEKQHNES